MSKNKKKKRQKTGNKYAKNSKVEQMEKLRQAGK